MLARPASRLVPLALVFALAAPLDAAQRGRREAEPIDPDEVEVPRPSTTPVPAAEVERAVARSVELLLEMQEALDASPDGAPFRAKGSSDVPAEWPYEGVYRVRESRSSRDAKIPMGYRVGGTAIAAWSLLDAPGWTADAPRRAAVERALAFVLDGLAHPRMSADFDGRYDVRGWGHAYALAFLLRSRELERVPASLDSAVDAAIAGLVETLERTEIPEEGGWNYARPGGADGPSPPSTFMTAPTLQALFAAKAQGEAVDDAVVARALDVIERGRLDTNAYQYGVRRRKSGEGFEAIPGAIGRMAVCETTLALAGRGDPARLRGAIAAFFEHWGWLEVRRKQTGTHVAPYMIAPYYFWFAHLYVAQAIELLPALERPEWRAKLAAAIFGVREASGGWNDRVFPRSEGFGTATVLLALTRPAHPLPAAWETPLEPDSTSGRDARTGSSSGADGAGSR